MEWNEESRSLDIGVRADIEHYRITADDTPQKSNLPVGTPVAKALKTDIKTYVDGDEVPAVNIGGSTILYFDALEAYGDVDWLADKREIRYTYRPSWSLVLHDTDYNADISKKIHSLSVSAVKNPKGDFDLGGENLDYFDNVHLDYSKKMGLRFYLSMYRRIDDGQLSEFGALFGGTMVKYDGTILSDSAEFPMSI